MDSEAFLGAPVSKGMLLGSVVATSVTRLSVGGVGLEAVDVVRLGGGWLCYGSMGELVLGSILMITLKTMEKWSGSRKFAGYVLVTGSLSLAFQLLLYKAVGLPAFGKFRPGPVSIVFSLLVKYFIDVPSTSVFSEKLIVYVWAVLYCYVAGAVPQAVLGVVSGMVAVSTVLPFKNFSVPKSVGDVVWKYFGRFFATAPRVRPTPGEVMAYHEGGYQDGPYQEQLLPGTGESWGDPSIRRRRAPIDPELQQALQQSLSDSAPPPLPESSITSLIEMGFDRDDAAAALRRSGGSVEGAVQVLMGGF